MITDRRHRRFCNLLWVQQEDKTFALERCETDQEYAADGSTVGVGQGANPAPLVYGLQDHVGMHMHPDGAGFVLPEPDWEALWEEEQAYWDQETPQTPQQRTWQSGLHTNRSERNYNKQARLSLDRPRPAHPGHPAHFPEQHPVLARDGRGEGGERGAAARGGGVHRPPVPQRTHDGQQSYGLRRVQRHRGDAALPHVVDLHRSGCGGRHTHGARHRALREVPPFPLRLN
ncbi:hypothetical protein [Streptomyces sp. NPDC051546]|uniref:hypothetical protein n=1 Tax=Streptomyces sp. NPDC051546 TaxID=3365655 RepID=UPI0037AFA06C